MFKDKNNNQIKISLLVFYFLLFFILTEAVYTFNHPDTISIYALRSAKFISKNGHTSLAFSVLTKFRYKLPKNEIFEDEVRVYLESLPIYYDFPKLNYELAVMAFNNGLFDMVPKLFNESISRDPDFSFWYVELANYYIKMDNYADAENVLNKCMQLPAPRQHCADYKNTDFTNNVVHPVGFLVDSIDSFYNRGLH